MKPIQILLLPVSLSCLVSACTHDYSQFDATGTAAGTGAAAGTGGNTGGTGGNTGGTGGNTGGTGGNTGGTGGNTGGTGGNTGGTGGNTGGTGGNTGGTAGTAGAGTGGVAGAGTGGAAGAGTGGTAGAGTGGTAGSGTGGAAGSAGMAGAGGLDGGTDAPDDAPDDVGLDAPAVCNEPGALSWSQNGHCYFPLPGQARNWQTQRDACIAAGAHLATITSQEENDFVRPLAGNQDRWVGLYRPQAGDPFGWITGEALSYTDWIPGEPNETGESCGRITNASPSWRDRACNQPYGGVCERP